MDVEVSEPAPGVFRFHAPNGRTNWYGVIEESAVCLVDTGYPHDADRVLAGLARLGRQPSDVSAVLLAHAHPDHIGAAERLRTRYGVPVLVHPEEAAHARGERIEQVSILSLMARIWRPSILDFSLHAVRDGALQAQRIGAVTTFADSGVLDLPGRPIPVFTPGHTSGHCAFHLPDRAALLSGDALVTRNVAGKERGPRLLPGIFNVDQARAQASVEQLRGLRANVVLPGHGEPFIGAPGDAVQQALAVTSGTDG